MEKKLNFFVIEDLSKDVTEEEIRTILKNRKIAIFEKYFFRRYRVNSN
jgi:hypothetical protein